MVGKEELSVEGLRRRVVASKKATRERISVMDSRRTRLDEGVVQLRAVKIRVEELDAEEKAALREELLKIAEALV